MKLIKFDLPIDGIKAKNIEQLQDHFTIEILSHYRSGLLAKWLRSRGMTEEVEALTSLDGLDESALLKKLCEIFNVEIDDSIVTVLLGDPSKKETESTVSIVKTYDALAQSIDQHILFALRLSFIVTPKDGVFNIPSVEIFKRGDLLIGSDNVTTLTPGVGILFRKIYDNFFHAEKGMAVGTFQLSKYAENYKEDSLMYREFIISRYKILELFANEKTTMPVLRDALNRRICRLSDLGEMMRLELGKDRSSLMTLLNSLTPEQLSLVDLSEHLPE